MNSARFDPSTETNKDANCGRWKDYITQYYLQISNIKFAHTEKYILEIKVIPDLWTYNFDVDDFM